MVWVACACGERVKDINVPNPQKATFVRDVDYYDFLERLPVIAADYLTAVMDGRVTEWAKGKFADGHIEKGWSHAEVISDLFSRDRIDTRVEYEILECEACGRLLVETSPDRFSFYSPDADAPRDIFSDIAAEEPE